MLTLDVTKSIEHANGTFMESKKSYLLEHEVAHTLSWTSVAEEHLRELLRASYIQNEKLEHELSELKK
jgi:hypothetical protein